MNKAISCKRHPKFVVQWIRILKANIDFGCIKCLDEIKDRTHILYLPEIIENPDVLIPHLPIDQQYIDFFNDLNKFKEEELEGIYVKLEKQLICLYELLKHFIENGRANLEEFKKKSKESKQLLCQELKIQEIGQLIKQLELQSNENLDVQDQILQSLIDIKDKWNQDLMKEQSSNIKKIFNETTQAIYKFNLYCNKQISAISIQIYKNTDDLKEYMNQSFLSNLKKIYQQKYSSQYGGQGVEANFAWSLNPKISITQFPFHLSRILPQYYFDYILNYFFKAHYEIKNLQQQQNKIYYNQQPFQINNYQSFTPEIKEIVNGQCFWNNNSQIGNQQNNPKLLIFKSNNSGNPIFGYFKSDYTEYIFSFTHNEIYPRKKIQANQQQNLFNNNNQQGILFKTDFKQQDSFNCQILQFTFFGLAFPDLQIHANLIDGQSLLGEQFIWDNQNDEIQKTEYLFGGAKPNIQLCEVFYF